MRKILIFLALPLGLFASEDHVVCIHGFMGGKWHMHFLERNLRQDRWNVINWSYPSTTDFIKNHGNALVGELIELAKERPGKPIHFVAHSMGSLVLLAALNHPEAPSEAKAGRIVLIAPPLRGSAWARWLSQFELARKIVKEFAGRELMTTSNYFEMLGNYPESIEKMLVIAGSLGFNPILNGPNDGTVAVEETFPTIPHKHIVVSSGHKTIVYSKKVSKLTREFLKS